MKIDRIIFFAVNFLYFITGCDPEEPKIEFEENIGVSQIMENISMKTVISDFKQEESEIKVFDSDYTVSGVVVSSDESGNFYKTLILQDQPVNPEVALEIKIDLRAYFSRYNLGRKIYLNLNGLSITEVKGKFVIGYLTGNLVKEIPESLINRHLVRSNETLDIEPDPIRFEDVSIEKTNMLVFLEGLQVSRQDQGKSFSSEVYDQYNGERIIEQCENGVSGKLVTSEYADFSAYSTPLGLFSMKAVLTIDTYSGEFVYILNNPDDLWSIDKNRCDVEALDCPQLESDGGNDIVFYMDFNQLKSTKDIEKLGWRNMNVNFRNNRFKKRSSNENTFVQISSYNSLEPVSEVWLITPKIDLDQTGREYLSFDTRATFEEGTLLSVWYTVNLKENFSDTEWHLLNAKISTGSVDSSNRVFMNSGKIEMDCVNGSIHLGFRYIGFDPGASTTYDLDNIRIIGRKNL